MLLRVEIIKRLIISTIFGGLIGLEREYSNRPAGFKTHVLVTVGATLMMIISINGVSSLDGVTQGDPYRLAAQVVSGIGFLGAGTIMKTGNSIEGLTTAASLWVCAGIGLAVGTGSYLSAVAVVVIVLATLMSQGMLDSRTVLRRSIRNIEILSVNRETLIRELGEVFRENNIAIMDMFIKPDTSLGENFVKIHFQVKIPKEFDLNGFIDRAYTLEGISLISFEDAKIHRHE